MKILGRILYLTGAFLLNAVRAQAQEGSLLADFTVNDINGNSHSLYSTLDEGKTVVLFCFATWDSQAWEFYQQQTLETFAANYGADGTNQCEVWRIESEPSNTQAQLSGPAAIAGNPATDTYGNWIENSSLPLIDSSFIATQLGLDYLPVVVIVCPDRVVRFADATGYYALEQAVLFNSCQSITEGYDPAIFSPVVYRNCGNDTIDIQLVVKNLGTELLSNATIAISGGADGGVYSWSGELATYASDTLLLEGITLISDNPIRIALSEQNANTTNDSLQTQSALGYAQQLVKLELALDNYPEEVSWEIRDDQDSVIYNGGGYTIPYQFITGIFQLPVTGCYSFFLHDTNGDGLHGSQYGGFDGFCTFFSMYDSLTTDAELFFYDGSYNFSETPNTAAFLQYGFESGSSLNVASPSEHGLVCFPNPVETVLHINRPNTQGPAQLSITDALGRLCHSQTLTAFETTVDVNTATWEAGYYQATVSTAESTFTFRIIVRKP
ncbi:MAG: T9SS type A sorting domain-containing protein [Flavobacteriales bacterium]